MSKFIILFLLLVGCEDQKELLEVKYAQGYLDGAQHCIDKITHKFELWKGSRVYNKYSNIEDARNTLEDCSGNSLPELKTHIEVEQYLYLCGEHEILRKNYEENTKAKDK